jgi:hypothetical protein
MKIWQQLKWNPIVPCVLLALMTLRAWHRGFPLWSFGTLVVGAVWLLLAIYRFIYQKRLTRTPFPVLSDEAMAEKLGKGWDDRYSLARFGGVWVSDLVLKTQLPVEILFRDEPEKALPSSGWTIITGMEDDWRIDQNIELTTATRILRQRPELASYLDKPVGTSLSLKEDGTYEIEKDEDGV